MSLSQGIFDSLSDLNIGESPMLSHETLKTLCKMQRAG